MPMAGAPINFTSPTAGLANPQGLLGLPQNVGLLGGIAQGLQSALDAYQSENRYQNQQKQQQFENALKQKQLGMQEFQEGITENPQGGFSYSPERLAMNAANYDFQSQLANQKAKQEANIEYIKAGGDPTKIPAPDAYTSPSYPDYHKFLPQFQTGEPSGLLNSPSGLLQQTKPAGTYPADQAGANQETEQSAANNSGPAPSGNNPPLQGGLNFSGLGNSPIRRKNLAEATTAEIKAGQAPEENPQAKTPRDTFQANQITEQQLNQTNAILADPDQPLIRKADAVRASIRLLMDKQSGGAGGSARMTQKELDDANDLIKLVRTNQLDPGIGPDLKNQIGIFQNKIDDIHEANGALQDQYKGITGKALVPLNTSPSYTPLRQRPGFSGPKPTRVMQNGHMYILNPTTGKYE